MTIQTNFDTFMKVDIRTGTIVDAKDFPKARKPAYQLWVDFGDEIGIKKSSVQITHLYEKDKLIGKQIAAVINFPPRQIGPFMSEILVLGFTDAHKQIVLFSPDHPTPNGARLC